MKWFFPSLGLLLFSGAAFFAQQNPQVDAPPHSAEFRSMKSKIAYLGQNAARANPDPRPTEITEREANAYFHEGGVKMPKGVNDLRLTAHPGVIDGQANVDFDVVTQKARSSNPLLSAFTGMHQVRVVAQASGSNGTASIQVQNVFLDGIGVPQIALEFFAERYLARKYPAVGTTTTFKLPLRIDTAAMVEGKVLLVQK